MYILIVEDDPNKFKSIVRALGAGHDVDYATNVAQAQFNLRSAKYDLVLTDMGLPVGEDAAEPQSFGGWLVVKEAQRADTPVVVISGNEAPLNHDGNPPWVLYQPSLALDLKPYLQA